MILANGFTAITNLSLRGYLHITDAAMESLSASCPRLARLDIGFCKEITDAGLMILAAGCTALTDLNVSFCDGITKAGLESLAARYPYIGIFDNLDVS